MSKEMLKSDIKIMLCRLTDMIEDGNSNYSSIVSKIYSELDTLTPLDLFVTREYLHDALSDILASPVINMPEVQSKSLNESVSLTSSNLKVVPDSVGNFFVIKNENGQEKIVFQTNNKAKADEYVRTNSMNPTIAAPIEENLGQELTDVPTDDLPNTKAKAVDTDPTVTEKPMPEDQPMEEPVEEEPENLNVERMDVVIQRGNDLLSAIENSIDVVPDLNAITELVTIKVAIQDKINSIITADPSDPKLNQMILVLENVLEQAENQAIDIINKNSPGAEVDKLVPAGEIKEKVEHQMQPKTEEMEISKEDKKEPTVGSSINENEKFEAEGEVDEKTGKVDLDVKNDSAEKSEDEEFEDLDDLKFEDEEFEDEEFEDEEFEDLDDLKFEDEESEDLDDLESEGKETNLESLIDELISIAEESGADVERVDEIKENIYKELNNSDDETEENSNDELDEFEEVPEDEEISSHDSDESDKDSNDELDEFEEVPEDEEISSHDSDESDKDSADKSIPEEFPEFSDESGVSSSDEDVKPVNNQNK
jgi:hypothetical protein